MSNPGPAVTTTANAQPLNSAQARRFIATYNNVNANASGDTQLPVVCTGAYSVTNVVFTNASTSLTTAAAGLFTAPSAGGTAIVANAVLSALTSSAVVSQATVATTNVQSSQYLYLNVATPQGATATFDVYVEGYDFSANV